MKATLKKIITTLYPELTGGYHLPMKAEVIAIADAPTQAEISTDYRPYYAVDVMPLTPKGDPNNAIGPLLGLPLPVNVYHFPEIGQRVEIAFFNGLPNQPFIRTVLTENTAIPKHAPGETHTGKIDSYNRIDSAGNHHRKSPGVVHDEAVKILTEALEKIGHYHHRAITTRGNDSETIGGSKIIEALGAIDLLAGEKISIGTLQALALLATQELTLESGVSAEMTAPKIAIGDGTNELLSLVKDLSEQVKTVISDLSTLQAAYNSHTNPEGGSKQPPTQVVPTLASVDAMQTGLGVILKTS